MIINIKNFNYIKNKVYILKDINLQIKKGEYLSILGENGSGKSTLALAIVGLLEKDFNEVQLNEKIAIIFENPDNQIVGTTVEEDIAFGLQNLQLSRNEIEIRINDSLKKLKILHLKKREVKTLSGGEKQKLAFASLIALKYNVYILDEVTSMLDPESKKIVLELINQLVKEGKTIIQITHFMSEANLSKRSILIKNGSIIFDGDTSKLMGNKKLLKENRLI